MRRRYSLEEFAESLEGLSFLETVSRCTSEAEAVEGSVSGVRGAIQGRKDGGPEYVDELKKLLFTLRTDARPHGARPRTLELIRRVVHGLVERGDLRPGALEALEPGEVE